MHQNRKILTLAEFIDFKASIIVNFKLLNIILELCFCDEKMSQNAMSVLKYAHYVVNAALAMLKFDKINANCQEFNK